MENIKIAAAIAVSIFSLVWLLVHSQRAGFHLFFGSLSLASAGIYLLLPGHILYVLFLGDVPTKLGAYLFLGFGLSSMGYSYYQAYIKGHIWRAGYEGVEKRKTRYEKLQTRRRIAELADKDVQE